MSSRRIKLNKRKSRRCETRSCVSIYPELDQKTGRIRLRSFTYEVEPRDIPLLDAYWEAHQLLPEMYQYDEGEHRQLVLEAAGVLGARDSSNEECLEAITLLGHSPCSEALDSLCRFSRTDHLFAGLARIAMGECAGLLGLREEGAQPCQLD
ncbi:MAG: hypothetical protein JW797_07865 [Bradymonadales bacterium]|nr:hypothetical protein [Bradymonadales bacterium]